MIKVVAFVAIFSTVTLGAPENRMIPTLDGRIVGGEDANIEDYPYQISVQSYNSHYCGGVILSANWVITAAHCVEDRLLSRYSVRAGSSLPSTGGAVYALSSIIIHASYIRATLDYDIALLQLTNPIQFNNGAQVIQIAPAGSGPVAGSTAIITGWGTTAEGLPGAAPVLQKISVPVISQADCRSAYSQSAVTDRMFCAGLLGIGGQDACQGDSGGPVVVNGLLTGLVSWGNGCARPNFPGVKTNLPALRQWITDYTGI